MFNHKPGNLVACICEGNAEKEIIEILIENGRLPFKQEELLDGMFTGSMRKAKNLENRYLSQSFEPGQKVEIIRVIDSKKERYVIDRDFEEKIEGDVFNCITRPEIEILVVIYYDKLSEFHRSNYKKPSEYCKS